MSRAQQARIEMLKLLDEDQKFWSDAGDHDLDEKTLQDVDARNKRIEELEAEVSEALRLEGVKNRNEQRRDELNQPIARLGVGGQGKAQIQDQPRDNRTMGERFVTDPAFKAWIDATAIGGRIPDRVKVQSPSVQLKTLLTGVSSTSAGALVENDRLQIIDGGTFRRPLTIRDIVTNGTTGSDTVEYVREGTHTNAAAPVAEATATADGTGAKPESAMVLSIVTETVKTIAHWIPATRRALADAGQLRTLIDSFLRYGLDEELEDQMLTGSGTGENFTGILNVSGTTAQSFDTDLLTTTRKARTKVRVTGRATPTAFVMHPNDWQTFDLLQDNEARYFFGGPSVLGTPRLWGLPVIESEGMTEGTAVVADWRLAVLWDREMAQILVSDSHSDFFIRNLLAILAEMRAAFGVIRPAAFVEIDLTA